MADRQNDAIRLIDTVTAVVSTLAGGSHGSNDGTGTNAQFIEPSGLAISCNKLYVTDKRLYAIRVVNTDTKEVTTVAGSKGNPGNTDGTGTSAQFGLPRGLLIDPADASIMYVADKHTIRLVKF